MTELTAKQRAFVREYLVDSDATKAAKRAGYSAKTAPQLGYQLLQHPSVQAALSAAQGEMHAAVVQRTAITRADVVRMAMRGIEGAEAAGASGQPIGAAWT